MWLHNIRGIKSKIDSLKDKIDEVGPDVVCITETHLIDDDKIELEGYKIFRNNRDNFGGGILVAVRTKLKNICTVVEKGLNVGETLWIVIDNGRIKVRMGVIYVVQNNV